MSKIKIDTRVESETYSRIRKLADQSFYGNFSLCLREVINTGLRVLENIQVNKQIDELIKEQQDKLNEKHSR